MEPFHIGPGVMGGGFSLFLLLAVWALFWKGLALWHSSRKGEQWWFIALLVLNTFGILEIIYLFAVAKMRADTLFTFDGTAPAQSSKESH
jgi:hypothetical protein